MAVKQTAGREALGAFAPKFAELNDDVLFGQVWSREDKLSLRDRSIVTIVALMAQGLTDHRGPDFGHPDATCGTGRCAGCPTSAQAQQEKEEITL